MYKSIKAVVVGDRDVGKTSLLITYLKKYYPGGYVPVFIEKYSITVMIEGENINLDLFNMAGMEDYQRLRPLSYIDANVFLICFSLVSPPSFNNVRDIWVPEVMHHCPHVPIFLVGTKLDLRKEEEIRTSCTTSTLEKNKRYISYDEGRELAKKIGALSYFECSSESHLGHDEIFREAVNSAVKNESFKLLNKEKKNCKIL